MSEWNRAVFVALLGGTLACGGDLAECEESLEVCDIADADCQEHVFVQTACARQHDGRAVPTVASITRDEFADLLRGEDDPTEEERLRDRQIATSQRMLNLLAPGEASSEDAAVESLARGVVAFYTREDASVTIIETNVRDVDRETAMFILSHEFVHAQQDVDVGLEDYFTEYSTTSDSGIAARSVTEGEAMLFSNVTMARLPGAAVSAAAFEDYFGDLQADLRDAASQPSEADYTALSSLFPYSYGGRFVTRHWYDQGEIDVLDLYDDPPLSTATILRELAGHGPAQPVESPPLSTGALPEGWSIVAEDTLGAWIVFAVARRQGIAETIADGLAFDWVGDSLLVVGGPTDTDVALAWTVRFGSTDSAEMFARIRDSAPAEGVRSVERSGTDVQVIMAVDEAALATWEATFVHTFVAPGPSLRSTPARGVGRRLPRPIDDVGALPLYLGGQ
jgi:hypothetical protein